MWYISHEKHKDASFGICNSRYGFLLIARHSLLSLLRQREWKETLAGLEYLWTWSLIFSLFLLFISLFRIFCFLHSCLYIHARAHIHTHTHTRARANTVYVAYFLSHIFLRTWTLYNAHLPLFPFFSVTWILHVTHISSDIFLFSFCLPLSLFVPLFLFVFCFWSRDFFYADRYFFYLSLFLSYPRGFSDDAIPPRISIIEFSTVLPLLILFTAVAVACDPWPRAQPWKL